MSLLEYFASTEGVGVLGTVDSVGNVDMAVYARPHLIDDTTIAFIMRDRLSYQNLESNPKAAYLFIERGGVCSGKRLYLVKTGKETDPEIVESFGKKEQCEGESSDDERFLVYFAVDSVRSLVGD